MIHHTDMVVGIGVPRPIDLERAGGLAAIGIAHEVAGNEVRTLILVEVALLWIPGYAAQWPVASIILGVGLVVAEKIS
jgi:hypothetical protein